jgi:hypothetical protein
LIEKHAVIQNLSSDEKMDAPEINEWFGQHAVQHVNQTLLVDTERDWLASHAYGAALSFLSGIDTQGDSAPHTQPATNGIDPLDLE